MPASEPGPATSADHLIGRTLGNRFRVDRVVLDDALGVVVAATEPSSKRSASIRVPHPGWFRDEDSASQLRECLKRLTQVRAPGWVRPVGSINHGGQRCIVSSPLSGMTLAEALTRGRDRGPIAARHIASVLSNLCSALHGLHSHIVHGMVRTDLIWADGASRQTLLMEVALCATGLQAYGVGEMPDEAMIGLAPEVINGHAPSIAADVYGIGTVLEAMLTGGESLETGKVVDRHPDATPALENVLKQALAPQPEARFKSVTELAHALGAAGLTLNLSSGDEDVSWSGMRPAPEVGSISPDAQPHRARHMNVAAIVENLSQDSSPRWIVIKNRCDHGPFAAAELAQHIMAGEFAGEDTLMDATSGAKEPLASHAQFAQLVAARAKSDREQAERSQTHEAIRSERRSQTVKLSLIALIVVALVGGLSTWLLTRDKQVAAKSGPTVTSLEELFASGKITVETEVGLLPDPPTRKRGKLRRRGSKRRSSASSGPMSYEEAMSQVVDLGSAKGKGGQRRLTGAQVTKVMNKNLGKLLSCVGAERAAGGKLGTVTVDLAIGGDGKMLGASAGQGSASFKRCIRQRASRIRFPTFQAPRMGARYAFKVR